jgi:hypothetical protein
MSYDDAELLVRLGALEAAQGPVLINSYLGTVPKGETVVTDIADVPSMVVVYMVSGQGLAILGLNGNTFPRSVYPLSEDGPEGWLREAKDTGPFMNLYVEGGFLVLQNLSPYDYQMSVVQYVNP